MKKLYKAVKLLLLLGFNLSFYSITSGQISITALPYVPGTTNFNTYNPSNAANLGATIPTGWTVSTAGTPVYNGQGNGTSATAGYWALGTAGEYCLGSIPSGASDNITYTVSFTNNSGATVTTLALSWDYEQWRFSSGNASSLNCTATGSLAGNTTINAADYNSVGGIDGTVSTANVSFVVTGLNIANGASFGLQWVASNTGSATADKGIGIDNFNMVASNTAVTDYFRSKQTGNWSNATTWESSKDAITWVNSSLSPDNNANAITIQNGHTVTITTSVSIDQATINSGGQVTISAGQTLTIANGTGTDLTVDGTLYNSGTISPTGTIIFNASGVYQHAENGGTIPSAVWSTSSTCYITGITANAPAGLSQAFGNFIWDCIGHSTLINLNSALTTVTGNFTVKYAGQIQGIRTQNGLSLSNNADLTLNVGGNFNVDHYSSEATWLMLTNGTANVTVNVSGNFNMTRTGTGNCYFDYKTNTGSTIGNLVMNITGNFVQTGGYFDWTFQTNGGASNVIMNLYGNFSQSGTGYMITSTGTTTIPNGKIIFKKAGIQTISVSTLANLVYTNFEIRSGSTLELLSNLNLQSDANASWGGKFNVLSGGILDANTYQLLSSSASTTGSNNAFTLNAGAGIITANANGIQNTTIGTISTSIATRSFSSGADYTYDGTVIQNSGLFTTSPVINQVANLTINNTAGANTTGVSLQQPIAVSGNCAFNSGILTTTSTNLLTINDNATTTVTTMTAANTSFCDGPMKKIGDEAFTFHVGDRLGGYRYCGITAPSNTTDAFTAEFIRAPANAAPRNLLASPGPPPLQGVSRCEYWTIDRTVGTSDVGITLSWNGLSPCNAIAYVNNPLNIVVAHFNGTSWNKHGRTSVSGGAGTGDVTWTGLTGGFNTSNTPFSLGTLSSQESPLPVRFIVSAFKSQNGNTVEWINHTEQDILHYELERSTDGKRFTTVYVRPAAINNGGKADYNWIDSDPSATIMFYRVKAVDMNGAITYSSIVKVQMGFEMNTGLLVYPNPVVSKEFTLQLNQVAGDYKIRLVNNFGQETMNVQWNHMGGTASKTFRLPSSVSSGTYYLQVCGNAETLRTKIAIQ